MDGLHRHRSPLDAEAWSALRAVNQSLDGMKPDVEALLVNHVGTTPEHYLVSVDVCYRLVGTLRVGWRGFSGGSEVWSEIERLMAELRTEADVA